MSEDKATGKAKLSILVRRDLLANLKLHATRLSCEGKRLRPTDIIEMLLAEHIPDYMSAARSMEEDKCEEEPSEELEVKKIRLRKIGES